MSLQHLPPQQPADEVAVADAASSKVAIRIDRYFIEPPVEFPFHLPHKDAGAGAIKTTRGAAAAQKVVARDLQLLQKT